jgi:uncharacterized protein (DUF1501 family)
MKNRRITEPHTDTLHTRREFMRTSMLGAAVSWSLPVFLGETFLTLDAMAADSAVQTATGRDGTILVVLQMAGGNDGLNTVVPFADDAYHKARPVIGLKPGEVLKINDTIGLHPKLAGLKGLYDDGHLGIIQGVGYPNPDRSHFRSTDIWQTATDADQYENHGWIGKYFDSCCQGADPTVGVAIGSEMPMAFAGPNPKGIAFARPDSLHWSGARGGGEMEALYHELNKPEEMHAGSSVGGISGAAKHGGSTLDFLQRTALDAQISADKISAIAGKYQPSADYPRSPLGQSLSLVSRLIAGGLPTRVYYVSQGGYDTHTQQPGAHDRLLGELGDSLAAFCKDLKAQGNFGRVVIMTFSEFGRRVAQNGSNGTDHGAAAPMFILGGTAKAGLYGKYPSLTQLDRGDLAFNVDFRSVYATVLEKWLGAPADKVLGKAFPLLPVV